MTLDLRRYLDLLFGAEPAAAYLELRYRLLDRPGMGRLWRPVEQAATVREPIRSIGAKTDIYIGCAPRIRREGGRNAIERAHVLWVDCDSPKSIAALERFSPAPDMVIRSGSGRHAYWALWPPAPAAEVERANRRLGYALGADLAATDAARILRPPETINHKDDEPRPVEVERINVEIYTVEQIVGDLPDPPMPEPPARRAVGSPAASDDPLADIPPPVYVEALTGLEVRRDGKVVCPIHQDSDPSLHVYPTAEEGWYCYGCHRGGTIYDLAAALWGIEPRGEGFKEVRRRLEAEIRAAFGKAAA